MRLNLQDRIYSIEEYFRGIEMYNECLIVKVMFPQRWNVSNSSDNSIKVTPSESIPNEYFYYADSNEHDFDDIFDLIEATISGNKNTFLKLELLKEKVEELRELFSDADIPYERLMTLKFVLEEPKKKKQKKNNNKVKKVVEEDQCAENNHCNVEEKISDDVQ